MKKMFLFFFLCAGAAIAQSDAELEARVAKIAVELRCMVCQNQSIADSHADLAIDLRQQIREQLIAGRSEDEIKAYMAERYGDFILYRPPLQTSTWLLWAGPALLMGFGLFMLLRHVRSRRAVAEETPLSTAEHERAAALLEDGKSE